MARTKGKGSKAIYRRDSSPSSSPPLQRSLSPPSPPPKPNSPSSSLSEPVLTPPSSFLNESPNVSQKDVHASSPEHTSSFKETLIEGLNHLAQSSRRTLSSILNTVKHKKSSI